MRKCLPLTVLPNHAVDAVNATWRGQGFSPVSRLRMLIDETEKKMTAPPDPQWNGTLGALTGTSFITGKADFSALEMRILAQLYGKEPAHSVVLAPRGNGKTSTLRHMTKMLQELGLCPTAPALFEPFPSRCSGAQTRRSVLDGYATQDAALTAWVWKHAAARNSAPLTLSTKGRT